MVAENIAQLEVTGEPPKKCLVLRATNAGDYLDHNHGTGAPRNSGAPAVCVRRLALGVEVPTAIRVKNELGVVALADRFERNGAEGSKVLGTSPKVPAAILASLEPRGASTEPSKTLLHGSCGHSVCAITHNNVPGLVS